MSHDAKKIWNASWRSEFSDNGTPLLVWDATVFDDLFWDVTRTQTNWTRVVIQKYTSSVFFTDQATTADFLLLNMQMSHKWKIWSVVYPHIHWWQNQNATPNWLIQYRWQQNGWEQTTAWTDYPLLSNIFTYSAWTINQISHNGWITPPVGASLSDVIQIRLIRDSQNTTRLFPWLEDQYTWNAFVTSIDIHYEIDTQWSALEYTK